MQKSILLVALEFVKYTAALLGAFAESFKRSFPWQFH